MCCAARSQKQVKLNTIEPSSVNPLIIFHISGKHGKPQDWRTIAIKLKNRTNKGAVEGHVNHFSMRHTHRVAQIVGSAGLNWKARSTKGRGARKRINAFVKP